ncbi:MAG: ribonuclease H family protein [Saprospiraceae bacterium]|nr:ribonuclease H family protein [Saprospiraceae bacterium]
MAKKTKYYVVWEGNTPGVYDSWTECQLQVKGYPNARYQSFPDRASAERAFADGYTAKPVTRTGKAPVDANHPDIIQDSWCVDAACSGNPGVMEYRGVDTRTGTEVFYMGPFQQGTNNVGEFLALVHALAQLKREGKPDKTIYSDSRIAIGWVRQGKARTKLKRSRHNAALFALISRAEAWLKREQITNPILKWDTKQWGEIPADFGRK